MGLLMSWLVGYGLLLAALVSAAYWYCRERSCQIVEGAVLGMVVILGLNVLFSVESLVDWLLPDTYVLITRMDAELYVLIFVICVIYGPLKSTFRAHIAGMKGLVDTPR